MEGHHAGLGGEAPERQKNRVVRVVPSSPPAAARRAAKSNAAARSVRAEMRQSGRPAVGHPCESPAARSRYSGRRTRRGRAGERHAFQQRRKVNVAGAATNTMQPRTRSARAPAAARAGPAPGECPGPPDHRWPLRWPRGRYRAGERRESPSTASESRANGNSRERQVSVRPGSPRVRRAIHRGLPRPAERGGDRRRLRVGRPTRQ